MNFFPNVFSTGHSPRIKNPPARNIPTDFRFSTFSILLMFALASTGLAVIILTGGTIPPMSIAGMFSGLLGASLLLIILPNWVMLILALLTASIIQIVVAGPPPAAGQPSWQQILILALPAISLMPAAMLQMLQHWDKAIILRRGKFSRVQGAGLFLVLPFIDRIAAKVDTRIRVTDFSAERTLSKDNVPVHIDAICFWMIWDARKAILELENYMEAVALSAQTALRDAIGTHTLTELLSERDRIGRELQGILDAKTNPWGITVLSVEFTDIIIPKELEDAMSKKAQADREQQARMILGDTEVYLAQKMVEAQNKYKDDPAALQLRAMNMVYDALRQSKGSLVLVPSSATEQMNLGNPLGMIALQKNNMESKENLS